MQISLVQGTEIEVQRDLMPVNARAVALAFEEQVASGPVPKSNNDIDMDVLVLAEEMLACSERGKLALSGAASG